MVIGLEVQLFRHIILASNIIKWIDYDIFGDSVGHGNCTVNTYFSTYRTCTPRQPSRYSGVAIPVVKLNRGNGVSFVSRVEVYLNATSRKLLSVCVGGIHGSTSSHIQLIPRIPKKSFH